MSTAFNHVCTEGKSQPENAIFKYYLRPTLKAAQKPKEIPKSYRPLSISQLQLVFYERTICTEIEGPVEACLPELSFAYRPGRGTSMAVLKLKQMLQRKGAIVFFLDASDAFGCIKWKTLFKKLEQLNFDTNLIAAISRLYQLSGGRVIWRETTSTPFILRQGVRQGGCISGHLFNVYFAHLQATSVNCTVIFYADDLVIIVFHPWAAVVFLAELKQVSLDLNVNWNPDKCKVMQMASSTTHRFEWYGKELENVTRFVYLGWLVVRKLRNCDDEQAARQAGRFYAAAHATSQAYQFTRKLPWNERVSLTGWAGRECF